MNDETLTEHADAPAQSAENVSEPSVPAGSGESAAPVREERISLAQYALQKQLPHWLLAALRTRCPIEQHMRHGRVVTEDGLAQEAYEAHTNAYTNSVGIWDLWAEQIRNTPMGVR